MSGGGLDFNTAARPTQPATPQENERRLETLRAEIARRAPDLVRELFPLARFDGTTARIGDATGAPGESMCIELAGAKAGQWKDHNPSAREPDGDLLTLWRMGQGYADGAGFWRAVEEFEQHLGMSAKPRSLGPVARVASERAKLPKPPPSPKVNEVVYVYTSADGARVLAQVIRREFADGSKTFLQRNAAGEWKSPEVRPLYNLPTVAGSPVVVLVEGEKCADALMAAGIVATSLMGGSGTVLDKSDLEPLRGKQVVLWPDNDDAGRGFMTLLGGRLRAMGCDVRQVETPAGVRDKWDAADALAPGGIGEAGVEGLLRAACAPREVGAPGALALVPAPAAGRALRFLSIGELMSAKPPPWLVKGVLPEGAFCGLIAPPGGYKSFVALELSLAVAHGRPWRGHKVKRGLVVYVAGEGQAGIAPRVQGWMQARDGDRAASFVTVPQAVAMPTDQLDELLAGILDLPERPALIVLDTLARCFGSGDENSSTDMGAFVRAVDRLRAETGACVLVVHHTGKDVDKGARGSSALLGALDCLMAVKRSGESLTVSNMKQKDAEEFSDIALRAVRVPVEGLVDEDGEQVSTLVLMDDEPLIADERQGEPAKARRVGPLEERVVAFLKMGEGRGFGVTGIAGSLDAADPSGKKQDRANLRQCLNRMTIAGKLVEVGEGETKLWTLA